MSLGEFLRRNGAQMLSSPSSIWGWSISRWCSRWDRGCRSGSLVRRPGPRGIWQKLVLGGTVSCRPCRAWRCSGSCCRCRGSGRGKLGGGSTHPLCSPTGGPKHLHRRARRTCDWEAGIGGASGQLLRQSSSRSRWASSGRDRVATVTSMGSPPSQRRSGRGARRVHLPGWLRCRTIDPRGRDPGGLAGDRCRLPPRPGRTPAVVDEPPAARPAGLVVARGVGARARKATRSSSARRTSPAGARGAPRAADRGSFKLKWAFYLGGTYIAHRRWSQAGSIST